jgi:hypothetical protein
MEENLDRLLPSLGTPMDDPAPALTALRTNMRALEGIHPGVSDGYDDPQEDDLEEFIPGPVFLIEFNLQHTFPDQRQRPGSGHRLRLQFP